MVHDTSLVCAHCIFFPLLTFWLASFSVASLRPQDDDGGADQERAMVTAGLRARLGDGGDGSIESKAAADENFVTLLCDGTFQRGAGTPAPVPRRLKSASVTSSHVLSLLLRPQWYHSGHWEARASGRSSN